MTESQFLEEYTRRLEHFVNFCILQMDSSEHSKAEKVRLSNVFKKMIPKRAHDLIGEIMKQENLIANCPVLQDDTLVPLEKHLRKQSQIVESALLAKFENHSNQVLGVFPG